MTPFLATGNVFPLPVLAALLHSRLIRRLLFYSSRFILVRVGKITVPSEDVKYQPSAVRMSTENHVSASASKASMQDIVNNAQGMSIQPAYQDNIPASLHATRTFSSKGTHSRPATS